MKTKPDHKDTSKKYITLLNSHLQNDKINENLKCHSVLSDVKNIYGNPIKRRKKLKTSYSYYKITMLRTFIPHISELRPHFGALVILSV